MLIGVTRIIFALAVMACGGDIVGASPVLEEEAIAVEAGEPSGFTRLTKPEPLGVPLALSSTNTSGWWSSPYPNSKLTAPSASVPSGDGRAWQFLFPAGMTSGNSPAAFGASKWSARGKVYTRFHFRIEGSSYENEPVLTKFAFWGYAGGSGQNEGYLSLEGIGYRAVRACWKLGYRQQNVVERNRGTSTSLCAGRWYKIELLQEVNTIGYANGKVTVWVDGVQVGRWTDVTFQTASKPGKITAFVVRPVWGGRTCVKKDSAGKCIAYLARTRNDWIRYDGIYNSGL
jgi:hypothetical protein